MVAIILIMEISYDALHSYTYTNNKFNKGNLQINIIIV